MGPSRASICSMSAREFAHLSELVDDIKATGDPTIVAIACRALGELLHDDFATYRENIDDMPSSDGTNR